MRRYMFVNVVEALQYLFSEQEEFRWQAISMVNDYPAASLFYLLHGNCKDEDRIEMLLGVALEPTLLRYLHSICFEFTEEEIMLVKKRLNF